MSHDDSISNKSENRPFSKVVEASSSRRKFMTGSLTLAAGSFFGGSLAHAARGGQPGPNQNFGQSKHLGDNFGINFAPVPIAEGTGPVPAISNDYEYEIIIPWGTPLVSGVAEYTGDPASRPSAADQEKMVGIGHDGMHFYPFNGSNERGVLAINLEFGRNTHVLGKPAPENDEDIRLSQAAHGVALVELAKTGDGWSHVQDSPYNRRITPNTPVEFSGPVKGHDLIQPEAGARGTVNNCSRGYTPWGTYLTCEENFNGYFGASAEDWAATPEQERYGFSSSGFGYGWEGHSTDKRFDLSDGGHPNEDNRFGWVVEIDPMNPGAMPVKRTALGRFKHEGVAMAVGRGGRVVAYMGDDQRFDYIYRFVSSSNWKSMRAQGMSPLDHGILYAARFDEDGTGEWLELSTNNSALSGFSSDAEILTYARLAADAAGATPMDRPEWTHVAPNGDVYCTLTNNSRRTEADAANPLAPNADGHIIRWRDSDNHVGTSFEWDIFVFAQDTHGDGDERNFSDPDGIWIDPDGRLFIQTDGGQKEGLNNQMLVASIHDKSGPEDLLIKRLFTGVTSDEITGVAVTPDRRTMFINTQHPGNGDPARTNFPASQGSGKIPRDCTFVITRKDGGIIGS